MSDLYDEEHALELVGSRAYAELLDYVIPFANAGHPVAQCMAGVLYQLGMGVPQDGPLAESWLRQAAEQGDAVAWNNLGTLFLMGLPGLEADLVESERCYARSSELGFPRPTL